MTKDTFLDFLNNWYYLYSRISCVDQVAEGPTATDED